MPHLLWQITSSILQKNETDLNEIKLEQRKCEEAGDSISVRKGTELDKKLKRFPQGL